jgi:hypothetical protein
MPRRHHVLKGLPSGIPVPVVAGDTNPTFARWTVVFEVIIIGIYMIISAHQSQLRLSFRIPSSTNHPAGGRSTHSIAMSSLLVARWCPSGPALRHPELLRRL